MAKLRGPLLSFAAIGRLGRNLVIRRHGKDYIAETHPHPRDARTPAQLSWRNMYQKAAALWHTLSSDEKMDWERLATPKHMTGYAYFMSQTLKPNPGIYLPLQGGSMQGAIAMNFNRITTLPPPGQAQDPARLADLQAHADLTKGVHWADPDGVLTFPKQSGTRVGLDIDQAIPNETWTTVELDSVFFDVQNEWDAPNHRIVIKKPGIYLLIGSTGWSQTQVTANCLAGAQIMVNGVYQVVTYSHTALVTWFNVLCFSSMFLNTNDLIELQCYHAFGETRNLRGVPAVTWLSTIKIA